MGTRPQADIGTFPTPLEAAPELGAELGVPNLYLKREDRAGQQYGGNKIRKLAYLLGEALDQDCSRVYTSGGIGSNHVLATATYARELGLEPEATQFPQPVTDHVRENLQALAALDPTLTLTRREEFLPAHLLKARLTTWVDDERYFIPPGGSSAVGTLGFVDGALELLDQLDEQGIDPDVVVVPASSGGTLAGLQIGFDIADADVRVAGVSVVEWYVANGLTISWLANRTARLLDAPPGKRYGRDDIELIRGYIGEGYAEPTPAGERVQDIAAEHGIALDPTYTAKTVAAIESEFDDETVVYWHTLSDTRPEMLSREAAIERLPEEYRQFF